MYLQVRSQISCCIGGSSQVARVLNFSHSQVIYLFCAGSAGISGLIEFLRISVLSFAFRFLDEMLAEMDMVFAPRLIDAPRSSHPAPTWSPYDNNGG